MIFLYYFCFSLVLFVAGPFLLFKKKARAGLWQKLGFVAKELRDNQGRLSGCVWFHAVSVGEFNAVLPLIKTFQAKYPHLPIVVSTTTYTGQQLAQEKVGAIASVFYFPFDLPSAACAYLNLLKPRLVVIAETEIWPGFSYQCKRLGVKLVVVNGRMSPRSFQSYKRYRRVFAPVLQAFTEIGVQSHEEAKRYSEVGGPKVNIRVLGNLKFDGLKPIASEQIAQLRQQVNLPVDRFVLVAGSTHEGEETAMLKAYGRMLDTNTSKIRLVLVPRHPERFDHVAALVDQAGYTVRRHSRGECFADSGREVYLLDVIGKLFDFYSLASIAFVGGTIAPVGGHNIMEPYAYGVPVVVGPRVEKTKDVAKALVACDALALCTSSEEVVEKLLQLFADSNARLKAGAAGRELLNASQGALSKAMDMLADNLHETTVPTLSKR
ncbi:MAG: 3-deoxy-D-manno-octulosonic acid transferase [Candidatus Obscuribacterales bacterium]|jgi:3-deoxy-D-manno-octulosonic-acid transferase